MFESKSPIILNLFINNPEFVQNRSAKSFGQNLGDSVVVEFEEIPNLPSRPFYYDVTERRDISESLTERQMISEPLSEVISEPLRRVDTSNCLAIDQF